MNLVLIAVILVLALNIVLGYSQGFVKAAYSLVSWILVMVLTTFLTPIATDWVMNSTPIPAKVEEYVYEQIEKGIEEGIEEKKQEVLDQVGTQVETQLGDQLQLGVDQLEGLEQYGIQLPDAIMEKLEEVQSELVQGDSLESITDSATSPVYKTLASTISAVVIKGVVSVIIMLLAVIIVFVVGTLLDIVSKLPVLDEANKTLGIIAGAVKGFVLIWVLFAVLSFFGVTETGRMLVSYVYENPILTWLYENNPLLSLLFLFI